MNLYALHLKGARHTLHPVKLCVTHKMSQTGSKGAARVTIVTSRRYPLSYLECSSLWDLKNIALVKSFGEFECVFVFVIVFVFVNVFLVDF